MLNRGGRVMQFYRDLRILSWWAHGVLAAAVLFGITGTAFLYQGWTWVLAAEHARQQVLWQAEQEARGWGYYGNTFAQQRASEPNLVDLVALHNSRKIVEPIDPDDIAGTATQNQVATAAIALVIAVAIFLIAVLSWVWKAHRNLERAGLAMKRSALMTTASFLVPPFNLVLPIEVLRELHNRSNGEPADRANQQSDDVTAWSFAYLAGLTILTLLLVKFAFNLAGSVKIMTPYWMELVMLSLAATLLVAAGLLLALLVRKITVAQRELLANLNAPFEEEVRDTPAFSVSLTTGTGKAA